MKSPSRSMSDVEATPSRISGFVLLSYWGSRFFLMSEQYRRNSCSVFIPMLFPLYIIIYVFIIFFQKYFFCKKNCYLVVVGCLPLGFVMRVLTLSVSSSINNCCNGSWACCIPSGVSPHGTGDSSSLLLTSLMVMLPLFSCMLSICAFLSLSSMSISPYWKYYSKPPFPRIRL